LRQEGETKQKGVAMSPRILVLDDDVNILSAFEDFFKKEHCTMVSATSAEYAAKLMEGQRFDLLVTDVRLTSQSGVTFFLNSKALYPDLPVIVITGYPESIVEKQIKDLGIDYFFLKPLEIDKLRKAVRSCLKIS
jgi:DNA-binding NtrC family response regulator